mmetsp:Transcript_6786/g.23167  ORF Transcript_6786/g.23167 Transcript_6786/m.23167 type:complete len:231 (+) Transcript_6786:210-902(+)
MRAEKSFTPHRPPPCCRSECALHRVMSTLPRQWRPARADANVRALMRAQRRAARLHTVLSDPSPRATKSQGWVRMTSSSWPPSSSRVLPGPAPAPLKRAPLACTSGVPLDPGAPRAAMPDSSERSAPQLPPWEPLLLQALHPPSLRSECWWPTHRGPSWVDDRVRRGAWERPLAPLPPGPRSGPLPVDPGVAPRSPPNRDADPPPPPQSPTAAAAAAMPSPGWCSMAWYL